MERRKDRLTPRMEELADKALDALSRLKDELVYAQELHARIHIEEAIYDVERACDILKGRK